MTPYRIFWIILTLDLAISLTDRLLVFRCVQTGITKTRPCNKQRFVKTEKYDNFSVEISCLFHIFAKNIDCGYTLEPPQ